MYIDEYIAFLIFFMAAGIHSAQGWYFLNYFPSDLSRFYIHSNFLVQVKKQKQITCL